MYKKICLILSIIFIFVVGISQKTYGSIICYDSGLDMGPYYYDEHNAMWLPELNVDIDLKLDDRIARIFLREPTDALQIIDAERHIVRSLKPGDVELYVEYVDNDNTYDYILIHTGKFYLEPIDLYDRYDIYCGDTVMILCSYIAGSPKLFWRDFAYDRNIFNWRWETVDTDIVNGDNDLGNVFVGISPGVATLTINVPESDVYYAMNATTKIVVHSIDGDDIGFDIETTEESIEESTEESTEAITEVTSNEPTSTTKTPTEAIATTTEEHTEAITTTTEEHTVEPTLESDEFINEPTKETTSEDIFVKTESDAEDTLDDGVLGEEEKGRPLVFIIVGVSIILLLLISILGIVLFRTKKINSEFQKQNIANEANNSLVEDSENSNLMTEMTQMTTMLDDKDEE